MYVRMCVCNDVHNIVCLLHKERKESVIVFNLLYVSATDTLPCGSTTEMAGCFASTVLWWSMAASRFLCHSCLLSRGTPTAGCMEGPTGRGALGSSCLASGKNNGKVINSDSVVCTLQVYVY